MTETTAAVTAAALPPYTGEHTTCAKCRHVGAITRYRPADSTRHVGEFNGRRRHGPLPERMERECFRCDFQWDEALPTDDRADDGLTVDQVAHALDNCTPYRMELDPAVARFMAERLLAMVAAYPIPTHAVWQPEEEPPPPIAPQDPSTLCEIPHETTEEEDECERRRTATLTDDQQENDR